MLFSSTATREKGMTYIFLYEPSIYMGTYDVTNNKTDYINFGGPAYQKEPTDSVHIDCQHRVGTILHVQKPSFGMV